MRTAIVSYFYSFSVAEMNNIEFEDELFALEFSYEESIFQIAMMKAFNKCIAGSLNNNYFRLMKVPASTYQCFVYTITT